MLVYIVVFDKSSFKISEKLFTDITSYIDDKYVDTHFIFNRTCSEPLGESTVLAETQILSDEFETCERLAPTCPSMAMPKVASLEDAVKQIDESFSQMLLRKIDEKRMTDVSIVIMSNGNVIYGSEKNIEADVKTHVPYVKEEPQKKSFFAKLFGKK